MFFIFLFYHLSPPPKSTHIHTQKEKEKKMPPWYGVRRGGTNKSKGAFATWEECRAHVHGVSGAEFRGGFVSREDAELWASGETVPITTTKGGDDDDDTRCCGNTQKKATKKRKQTTDDKSLPTTNCEVCGKHVRFRLFCDGGSRGNPGLAAAGAVAIDMSTNKEVATVSERLEAQKTNNEAEYAGVLYGLQALAAHITSTTTEAGEEGGGDCCVQVLLDSKLVVEQVVGRWRIHKPELAALLADVHTKLQGDAFRRQHVCFSHIYREMNTRADALVNAALGPKKKKRRSVVGGL